MFIKSYVVSVSTCFVTSLLFFKVICSHRRNVLFVVTSQDSNTATSVHLLQIYSQGINCVSKWVNERPL